MMSFPICKKIRMATPDVAIRDPRTLSREQGKHDGHADWVLPLEEGPTRRPSVGSLAPVNGAALHDLFDMEKLEAQPQAPLTASLLNLINTSPICRWPIRGIAKIFERDYGNLDVMELSGKLP